MLYTNSVRLSLTTGDEVQAFVQATASNGRNKCLLLHGNPATMLDWEPLIPLLADITDVVAIDMPGFGRSFRANSDPKGVNLDRLADCAVAVADALSWTEPFFIVGHSHGGGVAQIAAAKYPERIAAIVLISTLSARQHRSYQFLSLPGAESAMRLAGLVIRSSALRPVARAILRHVMNKIWSPELVPDEQLHRELALFSSRTEILISMVHVAQGRPCQYLARSASRIECPVLLVHGEVDALVPLQYAKGVHELIVNAGGQSELRILGDAGHAVLGCQAAELADCITPFLLRVSPSAMLT